MELTATERTGWMRWTPAAPEMPNYLVFDFGLPVEEQGQLIKIAVRRVAPMRSKDP